MSRRPYTSDAIPNGIADTIAAAPSTPIRSPIWAAVKPTWRNQALMATRMNPNATKLGMAE